MKVPNKSIRIFLLDDHQLFSQVVKSLLDQVQGLEVVGQAYSIKDGLGKIESMKPDLLLLDHHLPDGNGVEATAMIPKKLPHTKIIFLTIEEGYEVMESAINKGAKGYLLKQTGREELLNAISIVIAGGIAISDNLKKNTAASCNKKIEQLSRREKEIAVLISKGLQSSRIALDLHISEHTVTTHRKNIMRKLGAHNSMQLAKIIQ